MIFERELFLRTPFNKPPFIGICYPEYASNQGALDNQDLPDVKKDILLYMTFANKRANIKLEISGMYHFRAYRDLLYDPIELKKWLEETKDAKHINFGHVFKKGLEFKVIKTFADEVRFVIPISKIYVFAGPDNKVVKVVV